MVQETTEEARAGVSSEEALTTITHVGPLPDIEVVEFGEEGEESVPLRELGSMLLGRMQTEEAQEPELLAEPSLDEESLLSPGARATIPSHRYVCRLSEAWDAKLLYATGAVKGMLEEGTKVVQVCLAHLPHSEKPPHMPQPAPECRWWHQGHLPRYQAGREAVDLCRQRCSE